MIETVITAAIIGLAGFWFVRWLRGTARGEGGCSCGKCSKNCPARGMAQAGCDPSGE